MAFKHYVLVCGGEGCESKRALAVHDALLKEVRDQGVENEVQVLKAGSFGFCGECTAVQVLPDQTLYVGVKAEDAAAIVTQHLKQGRPVTRLVFDAQKNAKMFPTDVPVGHQKQLRIVLRNCGVIDPEKIGDYLARDGYMALEKALFKMKPEDVLEELKKAGLRGRGGGGYPTWQKWMFTKKVVSDQKYIICNADEGDPGAYMDRSTLEGDPHSVLEAMAIAGYTVGASQGYIYIRAEYPLAINRLNMAIAQARELGLLGKGILGSGFDFDIELRLGAGAFVCGEETALITSIEGNRGMPSPRPPYPAVRGLWDKPTVINNVETWAAIPVILLKGGDWFGKIGTATSKGTKVFALTGKVNNCGLIEVPMGITLREIIYEIGGGMLNGKAFKAVQTGGPSGGVITKDYLDMPIDYEALSQLGSIMGSGGMIVMDEDDCMVDVSKFYLEFTVDESCGKCAPCRIGGRTLYNLVDKISKGKGSLNDIEQIREIGLAMRKASLCGLGQTAPNPAISTLKYFESEYLAHINDKKCPAGKCRDLLTFFILPEKCIGCTLCARRCPVNCIAGERRAVHTIDASKCIKCGECYQVCKFGAVERT